MLNTITIAPKHVYGKVHYYPACAKAELFCKLLGTKTLTIENLRVIRELGFTHEIKPVTINL